jgi:ParB family transcriptional regulator, chromosome partitioning protein
MIQDKRRALGRGLDSLLGSQPGSQPAHVHGAAAVATEVEAPAGENIREIPLEQIDRNPYQTRAATRDAAIDDLAASIASAGVMQPIVVRAADGGRYHIIAGERRWLASRRAGKATVPAIVKQVSNEQAMEMTIIENLQREDLNPMEHARAFERLGREFSLTQEQISQRTGKERATIANYLRLMRLPAEVQQWVENGALSFGHAKVLLALDSEEAIMKMAGQIMTRSLSVRQTEDLVFSIQNPKPREKKAKASDPNVRQAEQDLERALGVRVRIRDRKGRGKIVIEYATLEDFDRVVAALEGK